MSSQKDSVEFRKFLKEKILEYLLPALIFGSTFWISEPESLDLRFKFRGEVPADPRIVLIDIDDESSALRPPWNLAELEKLLLPILECKPAAVGIDLKFYGDTPNFVGDLQAFVDSLARFSVPIVLTVAFADSQYREVKLQSIPPNISFGSVTLLDTYYPESDHVVRRAQLFNGKNREGRPVYAFALQLLAAAKGIDPMQSLAELAASGLSGSPQEYHLINYANNYRHAYQKRLHQAGQLVDKFTSMQARELLEQDHAPEWRARLAKQIHDSTIVLVGATYEKNAPTEDWFRIPLSWDEKISGVVAHANILNWLLRRSFISEPDVLRTLFIILGLIILSWLVIHFVEFKWATLILVGVFLMYGMVTFLLFARWEIWLPLIWPMRLVIYFVLGLFVFEKIILEYFPWRKGRVRWLLPYSKPSFSGQGRRRR
ncbi:CHASE2 domain-containing protein [candidate division KSB1 bacterium]|nr:CHASE2 domain-containing protein [candidate division KSB1 bacterium]